MTYFSLRKRNQEPEPEKVEEPSETTDAELEEAEAPADDRHPLLAGLLGPGEWIAARLGTGPAWGVHVVSVWAVAFYGGWVAVAVPVAWALAVAAFIPREFLVRAAEAVEAFDARRRKPAPGAAPEASPGGELEAVRRLLLDLIGEARGVHLRTVLAHLQEHGQWEGRTVAELRVHLEALGIPVRPKVKVGKVPTRGVLRADVDALSPLAETAPSPTSSPPV
ncbi:hypothetical protein AB0F46_18640 [Streptomyces sp. NPDC026665]|uniref:hypothetical protein n=1 Tax=Streptomyces sp. NPDC026665 TaxID=3154798 RepID=UPI00340DA4DF